MGSSNDDLRSVITGHPSCSVSTVTNIRLILRNAVGFCLLLLIAPSLLERGRAITQQFSSVDSVNYRLGRQQSGIAPGDPSTAESGPLASRDSAVQYFCRNLESGSRSRLGSTAVDVPVAAIPDHHCRCLSGGCFSRSVSIGTAFQYSMVPIVVARDVGNRPAFRTALTAVLRFVSAPAPVTRLRDDRSVVSIHSVTGISVLFEEPADSESTILQTRQRTPPVLRADRSREPSRPVRRRVVVFRPRLPSFGVDRDGVDDCTMVSSKERVVGGE